MSVVSKVFSHDLYQVTWLVEPKNHEKRLDQFLMIFLEAWSREQIKKKIKSGGIKIQNRSCSHRPHTKVHQGDFITMTTKREELLEIENEFWMGEKLPLEWKPKTVYEDDDIIICSKPAFMSTHPTGRHLFHCATVYYESLYKNTIHSIHRLDRETSGLLLLAKNPKAAKQLTASFENNLVLKCYFFIGKIINNSKISTPFFTVNLRLGPQGEGLKRVVINAYSEKSTEGKHAQTHFQILEVLNDQYILGLAYPKTGRQHQIRVHAAQSGFPLIGDKLYLRDYETFQRFKDRLETLEDYKEMELPRHALHAIALKFPFQSDHKSFVDGLPLDLKSWLEKKGRKDISEIESAINCHIKDYFSKIDFK